MIIIVFLDIKGESIVSLAAAEKHKRGDRRDGVWVKDAPGLNILMASLYPNRTDCEVYLKEEIDITELLRFIEQKNGPDAPYKTTLFHCFVAMMARLLIERPYLNRFIQGRRIYERNQISISFVAKRKFADHSEEALMQYKAQPEHTLSDISKQIVGEVHEMREQKHAEGLDDTLDKLAAMPRLCLWIFMKFLRMLDFWGKVPKALTDGDSNYSTVLLSNLGSIKCPSVYHHLNNYGTNSVMITIGALHKDLAKGPDGVLEERDFVDIGATLDERIGDGFYFARSLKLFQHICSHPELLERPLGEDSEYDYT